MPAKRSHLSRPRGRACSRIGPWSRSTTPTSPNGSTWNRSAGDWPGPCRRGWPEVVCIRRAWLVLGTDSLALEDDAAGYYTTELDLGYPEVRDGPVNDRPGRDGTDDRVRLM